MVSVQFPPRCRSIPRAVPVQSHPVTPGSSSPCAVALSQLSQLLLTLINLIRIIDQAVCSKWEVNAFPGTRRSSRAVVAMPKVLQVLSCKGMSFLSPLASTFPFSCPGSTQPGPGRLILINCSLNYLLACCWNGMSFKGIRRLSS